MSTLIIPLDQLNEVLPGDRLVAIDDVELSAAKVFTDGPRRLWPNGPIGIPFEHGGVTPAYLYPDSLVERSITVERDDPTSDEAAGQLLGLLGMEDTAESRAHVRAVRQMIGIEPDGPYLGDAPAEARQAVLPEPGALGMLNPYAVADEKPEPAPAPEPAPKPAPAPLTMFLHERERKALRRNRHYEATLRLLDDGKGGAVDLRTVAETVNYANLPLQHSRTAGALEAFYGWVEKVGDYTWRLTPAGRRVLAVLDQKKG